MANANPNDLGPNSKIKKMNQTIPEDLSGYQSIVCGTIMDGDIIVHPVTREKRWAFLSIGRDIPDCDFDVYRKMECPRHEGQTNWGKRRAENTLFQQCGKIMTDDIREQLKAKTDDANKPPLANLPWKALRKVSEVQAYGNKKYGDYHNYKKGMEISRQVSCAVRHIADFMDGIDLDKESGVSHLAHAATRLLFAIENIEDGTATDDRYKKQ